MAIGLVGRKVGMTRLFNEDGSATPVTVIEVMPNRVSQIKTGETDGYDAIQMTAGVKRASRVNKAMAGHFAKAGVEAGTRTFEARVDNVAEYELGSQVDLSVFEVGQLVDVTGTSKGKGFAGTIKRHNFAGKDATHGNSINHRTPGSIGQNQTPGRVFKGKKMSGQMGNKQVTEERLEIARIDVDKNIILIKGAVPGSNNVSVVLKKAEKA